MESIATESLPEGADLQVLDWSEHLQEAFGSDALPTKHRFSLVGSPGANEGRRFEGSSYLGMGGCLILLPCCRTPAD